MMLWTVNTAQQGPATTQTQQTNADAKPDRNVFTKEELQSLRDLGRQNVRAQIQAAEGAAAAQGAAPTPPFPPDRPITIRGPNGQTTVIGIPSGFSARDVIPQQAVDITIAFFLTIAFIIVGLPLARAFARRLDRRGSGPAQVPGEITAQLAQLNQAVDAIALEVERISEGQRFTTRLLSEQRDSARQTLPSAADR
ncbi:MAG TPA: hypothetical protein VHT23_05445 [Gemmatimonadaceae bacterium]|jgi:hypothetical protein|nr:hypothetical protein [Gemmatimonadaceae bacterium]